MDFYASSHDDSKSSTESSNDDDDSHDHVQKKSSSVSITNHHKKRKIDRTYEDGKTAEDPVNLMNFDDSDSSRSSSGTEELIDSSNDEDEEEEMPKSKEIVDSDSSSTESNDQTMAIQTKTPPQVTSPSEDVNDHPKEKNKQSLPADAKKDYPVSSDHSSTRSSNEVTVPSVIVFQTLSPLSSVAIGFNEEKQRKSSSDYFEESPKEVLQYSNLPGKANLQPSDDIISPSLKVGNENATKGKHSGQGVNQDLKKTRKGDDSNLKSNEAPQQTRPIIPPSPPIDANDLYEEGKSVQVDHPFTNKRYADELESSSEMESESSESEWSSTMTEASGVKKPPLAATNKLTDKDGEDDKPSNHRKEKEKKKRRRLYSPKPKPKNKPAPPPAPDSEVDILKFELQKSEVHMRYLHKIKGEESRQRAKYQTERNGLEEKVGLLEMEIQDLTDALNSMETSSSSSSKELKNLILENID